MYTRKPFEHEDKVMQGVNGRRTIRRRHLIYYLRVWNTDTKELLGHVVDITTEGLMLVSDQPIELNKHFNLEMQWQGDDGEVKSIYFEAESRWEDKDINASFCDTGFKILDQAAEILTPIREVIDEYGFND